MPGTSVFANNTANRNYIHPYRARGGAPQDQKNRGWQHNQHFQCSGRGNNSSKISFIPDLKPNKRKKMEQQTLRPTAAWTHQKLLINSKRGSKVVANSTPTSEPVYLQKTATATIHTTPGHTTAATGADTGQPRHHSALNQVSMVNNHTAALQDSHRPLEYKVIKEMLLNRRQNSKTPNA
ncbi:hypothetical protein Nepgr_029686 [Nepenthes gracilis]|uniref:Uncharacterized protein n=1 Tax=Nepenthes gracilis TaxID=150966 RepID=A0AAD3TCW9_NEPGR|nr:hypothetical protein Nepgr_029686 [Nepenthes gracilis]